MPSVTYSPEDNKLRLYVGRVPRDEYEALRKAGFTSTPKQSCDFVATWTPAREDLAMTYLEEGEDIGDEDYSPEERAADRAERFSGYRDKRADEASGLADRFDAGPSAFGHQNRARAERQAARHDRLRVHSVSQWSKAEYWQRRTAGVIANALYRSSAYVRRGRIITIETDLRRWGSVSERWKTHLELRLTYERAMLAQEGGTAADAEMERGGWIGGHQIHKVNKSPATGRVVSVTLRFPGDRWGNTSEGYHMRAYNVERLPEGAYRAPTDEERQQFKTAAKERKAAEKASKPKAPSLVNPTEADAERLQAVLNAIGEAKHNAKHSSKWDREHNPYKPTAVVRMTQAQYSELSRGTYSSFETRTLHNHGGILSRRSSNMYTSEGSAYDKALGEAVCKIRTRSCSGWYNPEHIVVITDKPQKPLPLDWDNLNKPAEVHAEAEAVAH